MSANRPRAVALLTTALIAGPARVASIPTDPGPYTDSHQACGHANAQIYSQRA